MDYSCLQQDVLVSTVSGSGDQNRPNMEVEYIRSLFADYSNVGRHPSSWEVLSLQPQNMGPG